MNWLEWAKVVVQGVSAVAWPVVFIWAVWRFRPELIRLLARIQKIEAPGFKLETAELAMKTAELKVDRYPDQSEAVERPAGPMQLPAAEVEGVTKHGSTENVAFTPYQTATNLEKALVESASSAYGTAVTVRHLVESELRRLLAATGYLSRAGQRLGSVSIAELLEDAERTRLLSPELVSSIKKLRSLADDVIHSNAEGQSVTAELTASGLNILAALRSIPHQRNVVEEPNVPIFTDENCTQLAEGHGLMLKAYLPPGNEKPLMYLIYPTTKSDYQKGKEVAWEWNGSKRWGPCWYRDPVSNKATPAWGASMEFVGRHLEEI